MNSVVEQILERYKGLAPETRVNQYDQYFVHAGIEGRHDSLWLICSRRGTVRLEYLDNGGETEAELILSKDRVVIDLFGPPNIKGLLVYVVQMIVPDLGEIFYSDPDVIHAKQSETYQKLVSGETDLLGVIRELEARYFRW
jgi:hypothetical protein